MASRFWRTTARMTTSSVQLYSRTHTIHTCSGTIPFLGKRKLSLINVPALLGCPLHRATTRALYCKRDSASVRGACYATLTAAEPSQESGKHEYSLYVPLTGSLLVTKQYYVCCLISQVLSTCRSCSHRDCDAGCERHELRRVLSICQAHPAQQ